MGAAFDRWLATPSTTCFLRRLLATTGQGTRYGTSTHTPHLNQPHRSQCYSQNTGVPPAQSDSSHGRTDEISTRKGNTLVRKHYAERDFKEGRSVDKQAKEESVETALSTFMGSGVNVIGDDARPEQAYRALWLQSNVASKDHIGMLLVDKPEHKHNMKLWIHLLQHKSRIDGFAGVESLWRGMRARKIDLPVTGPDADILWPAFINACLVEHLPANLKWDRHKDLLYSVLQHAKDLDERNGTQYRSLYRTFVGGLLRVKRPKYALDFHRDFVDSLGTSHIDLRALLADCFVATTGNEARDMLNYFRRIYKSLEQRDLYDYFVLEAMQRIGENHALAWHRLLISHGDAPSPSVFALPEVQRLFDLDQDASLPMVHRKALPQTTNSPPRPAEPAQLPPLTRASMSTIVGKVHGIQQQEMSDSFVAKVFATQALSLELVIKGLGFFGIEKLGPLALREMVVKSGSLDCFCSGLAQLRDLKIGLDGSVYGRLLERIAADGLPAVFDAILASDQHPEAFDDAAVQGALLSSYLQRGLMPETHLALLALSMDSSHAKGWNILLQHYTQNRNFGVMMKLVHQMRSARIPITMNTVICLRKHLLPPKRPGRAPEQAPADVIAALRPLQFLANTYIHAASHGLTPRPQLWVELLKGFGMTQRFNEVEQLVLWLVATYGPRATPAKNRRQRAYAETILREVFVWQMCEAFVAWSFNTAAHQRALRKNPPRRLRGQHSETKLLSEDCEPWARGLLLLKHLKHHGLQHADDRARRALVQRLWTIFGPGYSTRPQNQMAKQRNELSLAHYIKHANEVWGKKLLPVHESLLNEDPESLKRLLPLVFGTRRRTSKKRGEHADVVSYAHFLSEGRHLPLFPRGVSADRRSLAWQYSPFRLSTQGVDLARYEPIDGHSPIYPVLPEPS